MSVARACAIAALAVAACDWSSTGVDRWKYRCSSDAECGPGWSCVQSVCEAGAATGGGSAGGTAGGTGGSAGGSAGGNAGGGSAGGTAGGNTSTFDAGGGVCIDGWCWLSPWPMGGAWESVAFVEPGHFFTGGNRGAFAEWSDAGVRMLPSRGDSDVRAMRVAGSHIVFARDLSTLSFYAPDSGQFVEVIVQGADLISVERGSTYTFACGVPGCSRVSGFSPTNTIFPSGFQSLPQSLISFGSSALVQSRCPDVLRYQGSAYLPEPMPDAGFGFGCALGGNTPDDLVFTDESRHVWVFDGGTWVESSPSNANPITRRLVGSGVRGRFFAFGTSGLHEVAGGTFGATLSLGSVHDLDYDRQHGVAVGAGSVLELDGFTATSLLTSRLPFSSPGSFAALSDHDLWVGDTSTGIWRCDFTTCTRAPTAVTLNRIAGDPSSGLYLYDSTLAATRWYDGQSFTSLAAVDFDGGAPLLLSLVPDGRNAAYAHTRLSGIDRIFHWDGAAWRLEPGLPASCSLRLVPVAGELWCGSTTLAQRQRDGGWVDRTPVLPGPFWRLFTTGDDLYLYGTTIGVFKWDAGGFDHEQLSTAVASDMFASGPDDVFLYDQVNGLFHRTDAGVWSPVPIPRALDLVRAVAVRDGGLFALEPGGGFIYRPR